MCILDYLESYNDTLSSIEIKQSKLNTLTLQLENFAPDEVKAQVLTDMPTGDNKNTSSAVESMVIAKVDLQERISELQLDISILQERIQIVDSKLRLCNEDERYIMKLRYILNVKSIHRIRQLYKQRFDNYLSEKSIFRKIKSALEKMRCQ